MRASVRLCEHLGAPDLQTLPIAPGDVLDWCHGPVAAIVRCPCCAAPGLLLMLDWSPSGRVRIHALAGLEPEPLAIYRRNLARGSCDVARAQREGSALLASAGPMERLLALDSRSHAVLASGPGPMGLGLPDAPWQERLPPARDTRWFARLGLDKTAA